MGQTSPQRAQGKRQPKSWALAAVAGLLAVVVGGGIGTAIAVWGFGNGTTSATAGHSVPAPGTPLFKPAPDFTLTNQFGRPTSLRSFRGKVVILAFNDPVCTTVCPLTTTAMVEAKRMLGAASSQVQLLGVAANPQATAVKWVRAYSRAHEMTHQWYFLTASLPELKRVWRAYGIEAALVRGQIDHTPAIYVIDQRGHLRRLLMAQMAYASVNQLGMSLAQDASALLPSRPTVRSNLAAAQVLPISPSHSTELPRATGGSIRLGPGGAAHLYLFFTTWLSETSDLRGELAGLNRYQALANAQGLPKLVAVDEGSVEPSPAALPQLLHRLPDRPRYPVAIDESGRVADGYQVQDQPWFTLVSSSGKLLWYYDGSTAGWPTTSALITHVRSALARARR